MRWRFLTQYVRMLDRLYSSPREFLEVWLACVCAFQAYVRPEYIVSLGLDRLRRWWQAVEDDPRFDQKALRALEAALEELRDMGSVLSQHDSPNLQLVADISEARQEFAAKAEAYVSVSRSSTG